MTEPHYDFAPVKAMVAGYKVHEACEILQISGTSWLKYQVAGVDVWTADRLAVRLGTVPYLLWPEWLADSIASLDTTSERICAADGCDVSFQPRQETRLFCSTRCKSRTSARRRRRVSGGDILAYRREWRRTRAAAKEQAA